MSGLVTDAFHLVIGRKIAEVSLLITNTCFCAIQWFFGMIHYRVRIKAGLPERGIGFILPFFNGGFHNRISHYRSIHIKQIRNNVDLSIFSLIAGK